MKDFFKSFFWLPAIVGFLIYFQSLWFGSAWGDDHIIVDPIGKDFRLMLGGFTKSITANHFFPFSFLQCFLISTLFGKNAFPFGFHLYQLLLHFISCILAVLVLFKITKNKLISVLIVLLWTVHPLNVEILTRLGCAPVQVPGAAFCLAFIYFFLKTIEVETFSKKAIFSILGILFFLMSLTTYEQYILFPFMVCLIILLLRGKEVLYKKEYIYFLYLPIAFIYVFYILWRYLACGGSLFYSGDEFISWTEVGSLKDILFRAIWLAPQLVVHYFRLFFWPDFLAESKADWYKVGASVFSPYSLFCQGVVVSLLFAAVLLWKKLPVFCLGIFWFFITMLPVLQIIPVFSIVDEHYCYLAIIGIFISLFSFVVYYSKHTSRKILLLLVLPIFCLLTWRTLLYIPTMKNSFSRELYYAKEAPQWIRPQRLAVVLSLDPALPPPINPIICLVG